MNAPGGSPRRHRWYYGWNIVAICVLAQIGAMALTNNCFSLFLSHWSHDFKVPVSSLVVSILLFSLACVPFAPIAGAMADRFPAKWVFGCALTALMLLHIAIGFATAAWQIVVIYAVFLPFAICAGSTITAQAVVSRWFVRRVGLAMGLTAFGLAAAGLIFPSLVVWLLSQLGWRQVWWLYSALIALVILPLVVVVVRDRPTAEEGRDYMGVEPPKGAAHKKLRLQEILRRRNFCITVAIVVPVICCHMAVLFNLAPLVANHGFAPVVAGVLLSLVAAADMIAKLGAGMLADRFGNRIPLVMTTLMTASGVTVIALAGHDLLLLGGGMVMIGAGAGIWTLLASITAAEFGADGFGSAYGLISAFVPLGAIAPPIVAKLQESTGSYIPGLLGVAALAGAAAVVGLFLKDKPRARVAS